jgi:hypothetical protein
MIQILALLLWLSAAHAQNPTCPTRPFGDNTNACASTAFVQQNGSGLTLPLSILNGGNGTSSPLLSAGIGISLSGSWPNYTISNSIAGIANLSGSNKTTTTTCASGNPVISLGAAQDFVNGQGIALEHCGATFSGAAPTAFAVSANSEASFGQGPTGSTTYAYQIACVDAGGGVGAALTAVTITNGNATLGTITQSSRQIAYNAVTWTSSCPGVAVWRNRAGAGYQLLGVFSNAAQIFTCCPVATYSPEIDDAGMPQVTIPFIPATPPASALNDRLVTTISSGGGTTNLTLAAAPTNAASGAYVRHDDTAALNTYLTSASSASIPAGTYNVENITFPTTLGSFSGAGEAATIFQGWSSSGYTLFGTGMPAGFSVTGLTSTPVTVGNGNGLEIASTTNCRVAGNSLSGQTALFLTGDSACVVSDNTIVTWYNDAITELGGTSNVFRGNYIYPGGAEPPYAYAIMIKNSSNDIAEGNTITGGETFGITVLGTTTNSSNNNRVIGNTSIDSLRESYSIGGFANDNQILNNYAYPGTYGIDYCISAADQIIPNVAQADNVIANNVLESCGISAIAVGQYGGATPSFIYTNITGNTIYTPNVDNIASTPAIFLNGTAVTHTYVNNNTFTIAGSAINYLVQESNANGYGYPSYTQVGTMFGIAGVSGTSSLSGTGSVKLTGGSTGL